MKKWRGRLRYGWGHPYYDTTGNFPRLSQNQQLFCNTFVHERVVIFATEIRNLSILRENDYCVWPDTDFAGAGQSVDTFFLSFDVRCRVIVKVWTIIVGVTVKARFP